MWHGSASVASLALALVLLAAPGAAALEKQADPLTRWREMIEARARHDALVQSIELRYHMTWRAGEEINPRWREFASLVYARSGDRYFQCVMLRSGGAPYAPGDDPRRFDPSTVPPGTKHVRVASDGKTIRRTDDTQYVTESVDPDRIPLSHPPPAAMADLVKTETLERFVREGRFRVASVTRVVVGDTPCESVTFVRAADGSVWLEVCYDPARGWIPIRSVEYVPGGGLDNKCSVPEIAERRWQGQRIFYPLRIDLESFDPGGASVSLRRYQVVDESLRINEGIAEAEFLIRPGPTQTLQNLDAREAEAAR